MIKNSKKSHKYEKYNKNNIEQESLLLVKNK